MDSEEQVMMENDEDSPGTIPFQLQFDKPIPSQIKIAEWNPEKDLLAMVTEDSKILLHRFNWQRLWMVSPGRLITSLCWRPDGKAIAVGLEDGSISLHDVENGKLLRSIKSHSLPVVCLNWVEDSELTGDGNIGVLTYEDRTMHFFPPAPRIPRIPGLSSGDTGLIDDPGDSFHELSNASLQRFNILSSGDKGGSICFSIFGIFPIGKINIHRFSISTPFLDEKAAYRLLNASIQKVVLSKNLCQLIVLCFGELVEEREILKLEDKCSREENSLVGSHCVLLDTSIFHSRKNELHQVAQQASNIEDLIVVVRSSLSVMYKQWSDAMHTFHEKFEPLSALINNHGLNSSPEEEFLSLLFGARTSPPLHQFLVNSLGEVGLKRLSKAVDGAGKELHMIIREHLQPAAEIMAFRIGELRGLSRWRGRYRNIGLDEKLIDNTTEKAGMFLVQVERLLRVLATVIYQFQNFFTWLLKWIRLLMSEPTDQIAPSNSELVVTFLKFLLNQDPVKQLLELCEENHNINIDPDTIQRLKELVTFGGFADTGFLGRSLAKEFEQLEYSFKEAFLMPFTIISKKIRCKDLLPLYPVPSSPALPSSISYYQDGSFGTLVCQTSQHNLVDYICFKIPDESSDMPHSICVIRGFNKFECIENGVAFLEAVLLCIPDGYQCVDLSLYKESQIVLLLNEITTTSENPGRSRMMMVQTSELRFVSIPRSPHLNRWKLHELKACAVALQMEQGKVRCIPHLLTTPLAVSASRGVACLFSSRRRALVYILEEDEDEVSDAE